MTPFECLTNILDCSSVLQNFSAILSNLVTVIGICVAGYWAWHKWIKAQETNERKERTQRDKALMEGEYAEKLNIPSLEGSLSPKVICTIGDNSLVDISAIIKNTGGIPINVDTGYSIVGIFKIDESFTEIGPLYKPGEHWKEMPHVRPLKYWSWFVLEPHTESSLSALALLPSNEKFWIVWKLVRQHDELHERASYKFNDILKT